MSNFPIHNFLKNLHKYNLLLFLIAVMSAIIFAEDPLLQFIFTFSIGLLFSHLTLSYLVLKNFNTHYSNFISETEKQNYNKEELDHLSNEGLKTLMSSNKKIMLICTIALFPFSMILSLGSITSSVFFKSLIFSTLIFSHFKIFINYHHEFKKRESHKKV